LTGAPIHAGEETTAIPPPAPQVLALKAVISQGDAQQKTSSFLDSKRAEIARQVAEFKALQERIEREDRPGLPSL
jgi:hypothetical protein